MAETLQLRVASIQTLATNVKQFDLVAPEGESLPAFRAGAHLDLHLPNGLVRQYSLVNAPDDRHAYRVAVQLDARSRGGSRFLHESVVEGQWLRAGAPRNTFALAEHDALSVFFAGGIGITPLWSMVQQLDATRRAWRLFYCSASDDRAAFLQALRRSALPGHLVEVFDGGRPERMLDLPRTVAGLPADAHLYCCGPSSMIRAFEACTAARDPDTVHVEYFGPTVSSTPAAETAFSIVLGRSGQTLTVAPDQSILDALRDCGIDVPHSCRMGVCGTCETRVLAGTPDHRDQVLSDSERAAGSTMMLCVSRAKSDALTLDL